MDNVDNVKKIAVLLEFQRDSLMWTAYSVDKQWTVNVDKCKTSLIGVIFLNKNTENMYKK